MDRLRAVLAENGLRIVANQSMDRVSRVLGARARVFVYQIQREVN